MKNVCRKTRVSRIRSQKRLVPHHYLFTPLPHPCPVAIGSTFYEHQAQKPSFHSFCSNTLRSFRSSTTSLLSVPFFHAVFRAFFPNQKAQCKCKSFVPQHLPHGPTHRTGRTAYAKPAPQTSYPSQQHSPNPFVIQSREYWNE